MSVFFISLVGLLPVFLWFWLWRIQDKEKEPFKAMVWCFLMGAILGVGFVLFDFIYPSVLGSFNPIFLIFLLAFIEELLKAFVLVLGIELSRRWFSQIVDGLIYGSVVALGFAFAENVYYLINFAVWNMSFALVYLMRSLNTMLAHSLFTAFFGFFYASAYLREDVFHISKRLKPWKYFWRNVWESLPLHVTLFHILPNRPSMKGHYPVSLVFEGILIAGMLHGVFNVLFQIKFMGMSFGFLTFPMIFGLAYLIWRMFFQKIYVAIINRVKTRT